MNAEELEEAAAIAMGVAAYKTRLLFERMKGEAEPVPEGAPAAPGHAPGGT